MNFEARLNFVLKNRKKTPWGKLLGLTSTSISSMFKGHTPGPEFLNAIGRAENVNLNWLLTGNGTPYIVNHYLLARDLHNQLVCMLEDEKWVTYVCLLEECTIVVLSQPGQYDFKGTWIDYTILEVIVGQGSEELAKWLRNRSSCSEILIPNLIPSDIIAIANGTIGTYQLLNAEHALLANNHIARDLELQYFPKTVVSEPVNLALMRAVIRIVENCENEVGESLTADQKSRIITAVYRQAERLNLNPADLTYENVRTAIDVARD